MFYFVLGVLSVLVLMLIWVLIFGMVKVLRLVKSNKDLENLLQKEVDHLHRRMDETTKEIYNDFYKSRNEIDQNLKELYSYTDKRIDKSLSSKKEK